MELLFLGTGAADWPAPTHPATEFTRRRSAAVLNGDLMIDCSPDVPDYLLDDPHALDAVSNVIFTHTHGDHYSPEALGALCARTGAKVWAEPGAAAAIRRDLPAVTVCDLPIGAETDVGGYSVLPLRANHFVNDPAQQPVHYVIRRDDRQLFWGCDGAWLRTDTWLVLRRLKFDAMVLDGTLGDCPGDSRIFEHNTLPMLRLMVETFRQQNVIGPAAKVLLQHMSKYSQLGGDELARRAAEFGAEPSYDGLRVSF